MYLCCYLQNYRKMEKELGPEEIGRRINKLRKQKGWSQEDLANHIQISRPSLAQIELGNRKISVSEFQRIANVLGFSLDQFFSDEFDVDELAQQLRKSNVRKEGYRNSNPNLNVDKFSNVLLYILEKCAGKPNVGETVLYKLLYFSDFNYYELYEEQMTGATYHKLPYGPVPHRVVSIINQMIENGSLQRVKTKYHRFTQTRYMPLRKSNLQELKASEKEVLDRVIEQFSDWSAKAISDYSHKDMPWLVSKEGEVIDYELALYREAPYSVRNYDEETE